MIFKFFKKVIKNYVNWIRMVKFHLELENEIKKFNDCYWREVSKD